MGKIKYNTGEVAQIGDIIQYISCGKKNNAMIVDIIYHNGKYYIKELKIKNPIMSRMVNVYIKNVKFIKRGS